MASEREINRHPTLMAAKITSRSALPIDLNTSLPVPTQEEAVIK